MNLSKVSFALLLAAGLAACNSDQTTTETTSTDTAAMATSTTPMATTTTTTTTTTAPVMYTPKPDVEYIDLRSNKKIKVRVDTVHHYIVNSVTNQPVDFILEPGTTDTIYGRNMRIANRAIRYNGNDWIYDESLMNSSSSMDNSANTSTSTMDNSNMSNTTTTNGTNIPDDARKVKIKENENGTKTKIKK